jgi:hypothetical protein
VYLAFAMKKLFNHRLLEPAPALIAMLSQKKIDDKIN